MFRRWHIDRGNAFFFQRHNNVSRMWSVYRMKCTCGDRKFFLELLRIKSKDFHFTQFISYVMFGETDTLISLFLYRKPRFTRTLIKTDDEEDLKSVNSIGRLHNTFWAKVNGKDDASTF